MRSRIFLFAVLTLGLFAQCEVTIPESDSTPPTFIFEITHGLPGGLLRISSDDDLSGKRLQLRRNQIYRFRFTGSDAGGLEELKLRANWPTNFLELGPPSVEYAILTDDASFRELIWKGTRSDPRSSHIIVGQLHTIMYNQSYDVYDTEWHLSASDFGGTAGTPNTTSLTINMGIVDDTQEVGLIDLAD